MALSARFIRILEQNLNSFESSVTLIYLPLLQILKTIRLYSIQFEFELAL